ncbi:MAG: glycoside hydrolase family 15 protein [Burkholderiales bacterium]
MSIPLESFGMIGDGETAALVSGQGSIDWLCLPRFDSPACFASLVGTPEHGHWSIAPTQPVRDSRQRYEVDTLVLETELTTDGGTIRTTDFMPIRDHDPCLVRVVTGLSGTVSVSLVLALRFDYGKMPPWIERHGDALCCKVGPDEAWLHGFAGAEIDGNNVHLTFDLAEGKQRVFTLLHRPFDDAASQPVEAPKALALLDRTRDYWRGWIGGLDHRGDFDATLRRSLLTLKALVYRPTGALVAAPTTSLPEKPGASLNWDYRYCWLRDASFAVAALIASGFHDEARAWRDWILRAVAGSPDKMMIVYRVDGSRRLDESELAWLPGYRFAQPVRIGNAAAGQFQLDVYGELMNTLHICDAAGMPKSDQMRHVERQIAQHVEKVWVEPDQGLWESRGKPHHYTYSKVMAWVAIDRFLHGSGGRDLGDGDRHRIEALRTHMRDVICKEGFNEGMNSFTSYFGGQELDASLLLLPKLGFLPADEPRMAATIGAIEQHLMRDGLVYRNLSNNLVPEGAFLACTCWLAECQLLQGRRDAARASIERVLAVRGPLGLLSEEYDLGGKRLSGNFPQALSHTALVNAVLAFEKPSP